MNAGRSLATNTFRRCASPNPIKKAAFSSHSSPITSPTNLSSMAVIGGITCFVAAATLAENQTTRCDGNSSLTQRRITSMLQHQRGVNARQTKVISLQGLDLKQVSNETAESLIDDLKNGANLDKESLLILFTMRRRLSTATAEKLIDALNNGANFDQESLINLVRLQLTPGPFGPKKWSAHQEWLNIVSFPSLLGLWQHCNMLSFHSSKRHYETNAFLFWRNNLHDWVHLPPKTNLAVLVPYITTTHGWKLYGTNNFQQLLHFVCPYKSPFGARIPSSCFAVNLSIE